MMYASIYGRLGKDAQPIATRSGKPMTAASLAVDVSPRDAEATVWVRVIAFGKLADRLALHGKGESVSVTCPGLSLSTRHPDGLKTKRRVERAARPIRWGPW